MKQGLVASEELWVTSVLGQDRRATALCKGVLHSTSARRGRRRDGTLSQSLHLLDELPGKNSLIVNPGVPANPPGLHLSTPSLLLTLW